MARSGWAGRMRDAPEAITRTTTPTDPPPGQRETTSVPRLLAARERHGVRQDRSQDEIDRENDGLGAPRQGRENAAAVHPGHCAGQDCSRSDFFPGQAPERFAEAVGSLFEEGLDRFVRLIARSNPRPPRG